MKVPDKLAASVRARWPDHVDAWLASIGPELDELICQHSATPQRVRPARYAFVVTAASSNGPLIFRASPDPAALDQAAVAEALGRLDVGPMIHLATSSTDSGSWTSWSRSSPEPRVHQRKVAKASGFAPDRVRAWITVARAARVYSG